MHTNLRSEYFFKARWNIALFTLMKCFLYCFMDSFVKSPISTITISLGNLHRRRFYVNISNKTQEAKCCVVVPSFWFFFKDTCQLFNWPTRKCTWQISLAMCVCTKYGTQIYSYCLKPLFAMRYEYECSDDRDSSILYRTLFAPCTVCYTIHVRSM